MCRRHHSRVRRRSWAATIAAAFALLVLPRTALAASRGVSADSGGLRGYLALDGLVASPSGGLAGDVSGPALGFDVEAGIGPRSLPLLFGVKLGVLSLGDLRGGSPLDAPWLEHTEVRHGELTIRLEPDLPYVRPFVDASVGIAALYFTSPSGSDEDDLRADTAFTRGFSGGLDISPWERTRTPGGLGSVVFTLGFRAWQSGPLHYAATAADGSASLRGGTLGVLGPFVGLTLFGWS